MYSTSTGLVDPQQCSKWPRGVMVSTPDSESSDPSSNLGGTYSIFHILLTDIFRMKLEYRV